jgi:glycerate 2-kinase
MVSNYIQNYEQLLGHGCYQARKVALECLNAALTAADTFKGTQRTVRIEGKKLWVGNKVFDLSRINQIYVVGAGKGSFPIGLALDRILGKRISKGIILVKEHAKEKLKYIKVLKTGHPVPNRESLRGGYEIQKIASNVQKDDLVFACMTGGCSALVVLPVKGITLEDKIKVNQLLLRTGAPIGEMNSVRKHLSLIKGGGLVKMFQPATVITLTQDTAPEFLPWPDPSLPDPSTFFDAVNVLKNYDIWDKLPKRVQKYLVVGMKNPSLETPKSFVGMRTYLFDTANPRDACLAGVEYAKKLGYKGMVLSTKIEGESKDVGIVLAGIAKEIQLYRRPFKPPCVLVSAGETTVSIHGHAGKGGPNQELTLGFARSIAGYEGIAIVSIDSEGTDGPTRIAGGIADGKTVQRAKELGMDLFTAIKQHDSSTALTSLGDTVITGPTGTNVVNLRVMVVDKRKLV